MPRLLVVACLLLGGCTSGGIIQPPSQPEKQPENRVSVAPGRGNLSPYIVFGKTYHIMPSSLGYLEVGLASWYGKKFHGRPTSNGERFDMYGLSAAHKSLPLPTLVRVTNLDNGRRVTLRVNDRGPFHDDRLIDLSYQAAVALGFADKGLAPVVVEALDELNYPELVKGPVDHESFYLQVGAFSLPEGAERRVDQLLRFTDSTEFASVEVQILQSEIDESTQLHKVWLGPIATEAMRDSLAEVLEAQGFGTPLRVRID